MGSVSINDAKNAKGAPAKECGHSRNNLRLMDRVLTAAQALWPRYTAAELSMRTGIRTRACEYWMARRSGMSAEALAGLLRSDEGLQILEAILGDAKPIWWRDFKRATRRAELRRQQAALLKALDENEQSELNL